MDEFLRLVDELRKRGAIKIQSRQYTVEFAQPLFNDFAPQPTTNESFTNDVPIKDLESLMYSETSKL